MKILILCTGNSCRSQMAQGFLQSFNKKLDVRSAGTNPAKLVNQISIKVMQEAGIDISDHTPAFVDEFLNEDWDYVITVCDNARENCPVFTGKVKNQLHFGFDDPSHFKGSDQFILNEFHRIRDEIRDTFYKFYKEILSENEI